MLDFEYWRVGKELEMLRRELRELKDIANSIDQHVKNGEPYNLTFFYDAPLTPTQREKLNEYLAYHFRIWATTWLHIESDRIRKLIKEPQVHGWEV